eukprot:TRINITY_DN61394_c0_g1_i1.p1 TRINITY_DN61394_c0_g1~~TRINITY_DN61394_c0_g1_i1.p1  ORF type:complete len:450 (+),score=58.90 TRINITY_DN61394_c0_g1_i1:102-1451(+)
MPSVALGVLRTVPILSPTSSCEHADGPWQSSSVLELPSTPSANFNGACGSLDHAIVQTLPYLPRRRGSLVSFFSSFEESGSEPKKWKGLDEKPDDLLTFFTAKGVRVQVSGDTVEDCVTTCKHAKKLVGNVQQKSAEVGSVQPPNEDVEECIRFCKITLGGSSSPSCFPSDAIVLVKGKGRVQLAELEPGKDSVLSAVRVRANSLREKDGWELRFDRVLAWLHNEPFAEAEFLLIRHTHGQIRLTEDHLVFVRKQRKLDLIDRTVTTEPVLAREVRVGDALVVPWIDGTTAWPEVMMIKRVVGRGLFAPLLRSGAVVVDGTIASCYALPLDIADAPLPRRICAAVGRDGVQSLARMVHLPLCVALDCVTAASWLFPSTALPLDLPSADASPPAPQKNASVQRQEDGQNNVHQLEKPGVQHHSRPTQPPIHPYSWALYSLARELFASPVV